MTPRVSVPKPTLNPLPRFQTQVTFPVSWNAPPNPDGWFASYDIDLRQTTPLAPCCAGGGGWQIQTSSTSAMFTGGTFTQSLYAGGFGDTYCFLPIAVDTAGHLSPPGIARCTAIPLDDVLPQLEAAGAWTRADSPDYFGGSALISSSAGDTVTRRDIYAHFVAVVATKCPGCGTVDLLWNGSVVKTIRLNATTRTTKQVLGTVTVAAPGTITAFGTVSVRVASSGRPVEIDGIGISG
jgi:hypothetical protein